VKVSDVIGRLRERGVVLVPGPGDHVVVRGPDAVLTPEVRAALSRNEAAVLAALAVEYRGSPGPCVRCGRAAWAEYGAERLASGELVCGDCLAPWDVEAGSVPLLAPAAGSGSKAGTHAQEDRS